MNLRWALLSISSFSDLAAQMFALMAFVSDDYTARESERVKLTHLCRVDSSTTTLWTDLFPI